MCRGWSHLRLLAIQWPGSTQVRRVCDLLCASTRLPLAKELGVFVSPKEHDRVERHADIEVAETNDGELNWPIWKVADWLVLFFAQQVDRLEAVGQDGQHLAATRTPNFGLSRFST
jgi:hypothetical protein